MTSEECPTCQREGCDQGASYSDEDLRALITLLTQESVAHAVAHRWVAAARECLRLRAEVERLKGHVEAKRQSYENMLASYAEQRDIEHAEVMRLRADCDRLTRERDEARAAQRQAEWNIEGVVDEREAAAELLAEVTSQRDTARAEAEAMRPVCAAAERWSDEHGDADWHCCSPLVAAVDAYRRTRGG